jgi:hypothetical protein
MNEQAEAGNEKPPFVKYLLTMADPLKPLFSTPLEGIEQLARRAAEVRSLAALVQRELPDPLGPHVVGAARRGDDLVVMVDSAAWSARVRYAGPKLKARLGELGVPVIGKLRVRVRSPAKRE